MVIAQQLHTEEQDILTRVADKNLVVYAGTLEPYQGIHILVRAFKHVLEQDSTAFLLIVGGTPEQVDEYKRLADRCEIGQHCHFTGRVFQTVAKHYADHADVQISSRISGTNTPLKVYEQLARGIPIVATNIYSHTQVLNDEVSFLVEPTAEDMARGIISALTNPEEAKRRAGNAQALYENRYSRRVYTDKMKRLFQYLDLFEDRSPNVKPKNMMGMLYK